MPRRQKMKKSRSKRLFSKTAARSHRKNTRNSVMRGGIRL